MSIETSPTADASELDLLQHVAVSVPCASCGRHYQVSLRQVLLSQQMLHAGCPTCHETECLPLTYATLADEPAVRDFERSWARVMRQVSKSGLHMTICRPVLSH